MINRKELTVIVISLIILSFSVAFVKDITSPVNFGYLLLSIFLILGVNIVAKKIASFYLDSEIEIKLWEIERYGFKPSRYFKRPIPAGIIFPLAISLITIGQIKFLASLVFDVKPKTYRAAKRYGLYTFSEMTEFHIGLIAAAGIAANLLFAVVGYLIGLPSAMNFSALSVYFALWNLLPFSDLDGNKIFFGSLILWAFLAALTLVGLGFVIFVF